MSKSKETCCVVSFYLYLCCNSERQRSEPCGVTLIPKLSGKSDKIGENGKKERWRQGQMEVVMTAQLSPESLHNLRHNHLWSKVFYIAIVKNICVKYYFQIITAILSSRMDFTFKKCKKWQVQAPVAAGCCWLGWLGCVRGEM